MLYKQQETLQKRIKATEEALLSADALNEGEESLETKLSHDQKRLGNIKQKIRNLEKVLGAAGMKTLCSLLKNDYIKK